MKDLSPLQIERLKYQPKLPESLVDGVNFLEVVKVKQLNPLETKNKLKN